MYKILKENKVMHQGMSFEVAVEMFVKGTTHLLRLGSKQRAWLVEEVDGEWLVNFRTHNLKSEDCSARPPYYDEPPAISPDPPPNPAPSPTNPYTPADRGPLDHLDLLDRWLAINAPTAFDEPPNPYLKSAEDMSLKVARDIVSGIEADDSDRPLTMTERRAVAMINSDHEAGAGLRLGLRWTRKD